MPYHYSTKGFAKENMVRAVGIALPISVKHSVEVCSAIRNKRISEAKKILDGVISLRKAVPYRRYNQGVSHKRGIGPGRFPVATSKEIKKLVESVEANAQFRGFNTSNLVITHAVVQKAPIAWHYGRQRRRKMKRATIEIMAKEVKAEKMDKKAKKEGNVPAPKKEAARDAAAVRHAKHAQEAQK